MFRMLLLTVVLAAVSAALPRVKPMWKESGWIGTCPGMGCIGRRNLCAIYKVPNPEGELNTYYCYFDN